jgi:nucleotide-binding universal stress UspA family protein
MLRHPTVTAFSRIDPPQGHGAGETTDLEWVQTLVAQTVIKSILASLTGQPSDLAVLETAVRAGRKFGAHVDCLHVTPSAVVDVVSAGILLGTTIEQMRALDKRISEAKQRARMEFEDICKREALIVADVPKSAGSMPSFAFREIVGDDVDETIRSARAHDLTVIARDSRNVITRPDRAGTIMLASGRATLVPAHKAPKTLGSRIVVAWKDTAEASRAVASAMPFLSTADAVTVVSLSEGETDLERLGTSARNIVRELAWHAIEASEKTLEFSLKPAAESILDEAYRVDADMLVMGGYGHSRMREFAFGGMTRDILAECEIPVLFSH